MQLLFPFMEDVNHQSYYSYVKKQVEQIQYHYACQDLNLSENECMLLYIDKDNHDKMSSVYLSEPHTYIVPYHEYHN